ncbi:MAG: CPBP family intramembrane metalloprotease [Bacteroidales bacterium]|nr:CPBP family intramembrane metalloprotease [Bacteroidales bacterium]
MHPLIVSILVATLCFSIYFFLFYENHIWGRWLGADSSGYGRIILMRLAGFFIFLIPYLFSTDYLHKPLQQINFSTLFILCFICAILLIVINYFAARTPSNLAHYPQIRKTKWNFTDIIISSTTWILYLIGYEFLFRGYLFFSTLQHFDLVSSVGLNVAIYMLVHIPKGYKETFGSIPMGIVLCYITYYSGSVWPAVIIHSMLALSNEWFSIYYLTRQSKKV